MDSHIPEDSFDRGLLLAAADLFTREGCDKVNWQRLALHCQENGVVCPFPDGNPRTVLIAIYRNVWGQITEVSKPLLAPNRDPRDAITGVFVIIFEFMLRHEEILGRCIIIESHRYDSEKIRRCFMIPEFLELLEGLKNYVDEQVRAGNLLPVNASAIIELFMSIQDGMMFAWTMEADFGYPATFKLDDFETVTRMLVSALFLPTTEQSKEYYDSVAAGYDSLYNDGISLAENAIVGDMIAAHVTTGMTVVDLGCGTGLGYELLARRLGYDFNYVGIDISPEMIQVAKRRFVAVDNAKFLVMNIDDMAYFKSKTVDVCISLFGSFSHVLNVGPAIAEVRRVLKLDGTLFLMLYSRFSWKNFFEALANMSPSRLAEVRPYEIRKTSGTVSADARFYTKTSIEKYFSSFSDINVQGLNCWLELPFSKSRYRNASRMPDARIMLEEETTKLRSKPNRCHSLIVRARKHD